MIGYAVITIALGSLIHVTIERPMLSRLRRAFLQADGDDDRVNVGRHSRRFGNIHG
jgi:hypothetical protein